MPEPRSSESPKPPSWSEWKDWIGKRQWLSPLARAEWASEWVYCGLRRLALFDLLELAGKLTVLVVVVIWFLEADDRAKQRHYRAWELINSARGSPGDGGRIDALQDLNRDRVSLAGAPLEQAPLLGVDLKGAHLSGANLQGAHLSGANLRFANLRLANLQGAHLWEANLQGANLQGADLFRANLRFANLRDPTCASRPAAVLPRSAFTSVEGFPRRNLKTAHTPVATAAAPPPIQASVCWLLGFNSQPQSMILCEPLSAEG